MNIWERTIQIKTGVAGFVDHCPRVLRNHRVWLAMLVYLGMSAYQTQAALVGYDAGTDVVSFTPGDALDPVITVATAAISLAVGLFVAWTGVRWIYRAIRSM